MGLEESGYTFTWVMRMVYDFVFPEGYEAKAWISSSTKAAEYSDDEVVAG